MKKVNDITILPAFGDNYIYLLEYSPGQCLVVDPGDATPVFDVLEHLNLELTHVLITHHHADHIGGVRTLKQNTSCQVIGPDRQRISEIDVVVRDGESIELDKTLIRCISTPGHTASSVCYFATGGQLESPVLFTGDTLFVCGCGRMFESDGETMHTSLQKLTSLPDETLIYPGHDYTEENVRFALMFEPENKHLQKKLKLIRKQCSDGQPTVPSALNQEKQMNPFLVAKDWQAFTILRKKKDAF